MARKPMTKARAKRLIGIGTAVAPMLAPYALAAAGAVRGTWDNYRAGRLGVTADKLAEFTGPGGGLHARISHLAEALTDLENRGTPAAHVRRGGPPARHRAGHGRPRGRADARRAPSHGVQGDQCRARRRRAGCPPASGYHDLSYRLPPWRTPGVDGGGRLRGVALALLVALLTAIGHAAAGGACRTSRCW